MTEKIVKGPEAEGTLRSLFNIANLVSPHKHMQWMTEKERLILVAVTGSRAYGTFRPDSDYDYKGVCVPPHKYRMGFLHKFEQLEIKQPIDCTIFNVIKFVQMAANCNPNILDVLFAHGDDIVVCTHVGQMLRNARQDFLSKKASASFRGYAMSQIQRIRRHRRWLFEPRESPPTRAEFGLPDDVAIPKDQLNAAMSRIQKKIDSWEIDFGQMDDAEKIYVKEQMYRRLTELEIADAEEFAAAGRLLGYEENFLEMLGKEKKWRQAVNDWDNYLKWKRDRNPARAALERKYGYDCYLDDTEFLTERGWLRYDEIKEADRLATLNQQTGRIEYQHFTERVEKPYSGKIGVLHPRHSNCAVTPNHRMWVSPARRNKANGYSVSYSQEGSVWGIYKLEDLLNGRRSYFHIRLTGEPSTEDYPVEDDYLGLMGAYVSEGCVGKRLKDGSASVLRISQKEGGRLEPWMDSWMGGHPETTRRFESLRDEDWRKEPCLEIIWTIADRELASKMEVECGSGFLDKRLPAWTQELSQRQAKLLLRAMVDGDGTDRPHSSVYYTISKKLADSIQAMCISTGLVSQVWGPYHYEERPDAAPMYQVYLGQGDPFATVAVREEGSQSFTLEDVRDVRIVCFTVPNEVLVTRRGGKVAIQGNTKHAMHLVRLMIMCREIGTTGEVIVKRHDAPKLKGILNGDWAYDYLEGWAEEQDKDLIEVWRKSSLPRKPNLVKLDELCQNIIWAVENPV